MPSLAEVEEKDDVYWVAVAISLKRDSRGLA